MEGKLKFEDLFWIAVIVAAITIAAHWWFKKKCGCSTPRLAAQPGQPPPPGYKRAGVTSCG